VSEYRTRLFVHPVTDASTEIFFADPTFEWCLLVLASVPARLLGRRATPRIGTRCPARRFLTAYASISLPTRACVEAGEVSTL
jgi:hypothetical protein